MYHKIYKLVVPILVSGLLFSGNIVAQNASASKAKPLFQSEEILDLTLEADFKAVFAETDDSTYFPATMSLVDNEGSNTEIKLKIRARGHARRDENICKFTPLRLRFPKKGTSNTVFRFIIDLRC